MLGSLGPDAPISDTTGSQNCPGYPHALNNPEAMLFGPLQRTHPIDTMLGPKSMTSTSEMKICYQKCIDGMQHLPQGDLTCNVMG